MPTASTLTSTPLLAARLDQRSVRHGGIATHWPFSVVGGLSAPYRTSRLRHLSSLYWCWWDGRTSGATPPNAWPGAAGVMAQPPVPERPKMPMELFGEDCGGPPTGNERQMIESVHYDCSTMQDVFLCVFVNDSWVMALIIVCWFVEMWEIHNYSSAVQSENTVKPTFHGKFRGSRRKEIWAKGDVTALSRTSRESRHSGMWALLCFRFVRQSCTAVMISHYQYVLTKSDLMWSPDTLMCRSCCLFCFCERQNKNSDNVKKLK